MSVNSQSLYYVVGGCRRAGIGGRILFKPGFVTVVSREYNVESARLAGRRGELRDEMGGDRGFFYGVVDGLEENEALVTVFDVGYMPVWRRGQHLYLSESGTPDAPVVQIDEIDFCDSRVVHFLWMSVGLQFEGVIP